VKESTFDKKSNNSGFGKASKKSDSLRKATPKDDDDGGW